MDKETPFMKKFFANIKELFTRGEKTTLQKQLRMVIIFVLVAAIGLGVYFAAIYPSIKKEDELPPLLDGEQYYNKMILIVPYTERTDMKSIEVHNKYGDYALEAVATDSGSITFYLRGNDHIRLDSSALASAVVGAGTVYSNKINDMQRVNENATPEDLPQYGLTEEAKEYSWFRVTRNDGTSYKVIVGDPVPSGNAYYGMVEGRENVVYSLSTSVAVFKSKSTVLVDKTISNYLGSNVTSINDFYIFRNIAGERTLLLELKSKNTEAADNATSSYEMVYPAAYYLNDDRFGSSVLNNILYIQASEIMEYGEDIVKPEVYEKYGLDINMERIADAEDGNYVLLYYSCKVPDSETGKTKDIENLLYLSESFTDSEDGEKYYYVYSPDFDVIAKVAASTLNFVDWSIANFTSDRMYYNYIGTCDFFELMHYTKGSGVRYVFSGTEKTFNVKALEAGENGTPKLDKNGIPREFNVEYVPDSYGGGKYTGEFENFRNLYLVLITRNFDITKDAEGRDTSDTPGMSVTISTTPKDLAKSYGLYDAEGNKLRDSSGSMMYARYRGGYLICENAKATPKDGGDSVDYGTLYYDEEAKRFFQKKVDSNDGELKPVNLSYDKNMNVVINRYVAASYNVTAEYTQTVSTYNFYYVYETYTDAAGKVQKVISQTEMYVVPTITTVKYEVSTETGIREISRETVTAEKGMIMRKPAIDKLFEDSDKVLAGIEIGAYEAN